MSKPMKYDLWTNGVGCYCDDKLGCQINIYGIDKCKRIRAFALRTAERMEADAKKWTEAITFIEKAKEGWM